MFPGDRQVKQKGPQMASVLFVCVTGSEIEAPRVGSSIPGSRSLLYGGPYLTVRLGREGEVRS